MNDFVDNWMISDYAVFCHSLMKHKKIYNQIPFELIELLNDYRVDVIKCGYDIDLIDKLIIGEPLTNLFQIKSSTWQK